MKNLHVCTIVILIILVSCKTGMPIDREKIMTLVYPELLEPNKHESKGLRLQFSPGNAFQLKRDKIYHRYYNRLFSNNNDRLYGNRVFVEQFRPEVWEVIQVSQELYHFKNAHQFANNGAIVVDKNFTIKSIKRNESFPWDAHILILDCLAFGMQTEPVKPGDTWDNYLTQKEPRISTGRKGAVYFDYSLQSRSKLIGYTEIDQKRCAVIEGVTTIDRYIFIYSEKSSKRVPGSGIIYNIQIKSLVYLDYLNEKIVLNNTLVTCKALGSLRINFGATPQEAFEKIRTFYKDSVNGEETYLAHYIKEYEYK